MDCEYKGCHKDSTYCIEWWGLNQHGKRPEILHENYSCANPEHLIVLSNPNEYDDSHPDEINNVNTGEVKSGLLNLVINALNKKLDHQTEHTIGHLTDIANSPKGQLRLFPNEDNYVLKNAKALGFEVFL